VLMIKRKKNKIMGAEICPLSFKKEVTING